MAFLRKKKLWRKTYYYIVQSIRRDGKVKQKILEYLGADPDPKRLKRALDYWGVKPRVRRRRTKR